MQKHAYLIMCHDNFQLLQKILMLLDDERNDIYLHIDKKAKGVNANEITSCVKYSTIILLNRTNVNWGGYSQIRVELMLLKEATKKEHRYYHLLSGVDLPLKSQDEIYKFFAENDGKEFVSIDNMINREDYFNRIGRYHFFQDHIGRIIGYRSAVLEFLESLSLNIQEFFHYKRKTYVNTKIYKGTNWFSITHEFAIYLTAREKEIRRCFGFGLCADELFLQTTIMNSSFRKNVVNDSLRYIDWERGNPYIFSDEDFDLLMSSNKLFARKFNYSQSPEIIDRIFNELCVNKTR